jgi:hypothetical protein
MKKFDPDTLRRIAAEIRQERKKLDELFGEWESHRFGEWTDSFFLRGKASIFHDFYCGVENIFKRIASELNGGIPSSPTWHKTLLHNMCLDIPEVRPAVVSQESCKLLNTFLDFRHKFRNIYGIDLQFDKLDDLDKMYPEVHSRFKEDINSFLDFMNKLIERIEMDG